MRWGNKLEYVAEAGPGDFVYLDPPYLGTTIGRDKRYAEQLQSAQLVAGLKGLLERNVRFALSYDGMTGEKVYGSPLPAELGLVRLLLHAGVSSQATLAGRSEETIESLYLSPGLGSPREELIKIPICKLVLLKNALRPLALKPDAPSLAKCFGHLTRQHVFDAVAALVELEGCL